LTHAAEVGVIELGLGSLPGQERQKHMLDCIWANVMAACDLGESLTAPFGQLCHYEKLPSCLIQMLPGQYIQHL
jgi:hypothetical protein